MSKKRLPKGWTHVGTNDIAFTDTLTRYDRHKLDNAFAKAIDKTPIRSLEEMKKDCEKSYEEQQVKDAEILRLFDEKKLHSKALIKRAKALKKKAAKKAAKATTAAQ